MQGSIPARTRSPL